MRSESNDTFLQLYSLLLNLKSKLSDWILEMSVQVALKKANQVLLLFAICLFTIWLIVGQAWKTIILPPDDLSKEWTTFKAENKLHPWDFVVINIEGNPSRRVEMISLLSFKFTRIIEPLLFLIKIIYFLILELEYTDPAHSWQSFAAGIIYSLNYRNEESYRRSWCQSVLY